MIKLLISPVVLLFVFHFGQTAIAEDGVLNEVINGTATTSGQPFQLGGDRTIDGALNSNAFSYTGARF